MPTAIKTCRVCGKEYKACYTPAVPGVFRWNDVACSPECGAIYLEQIQESRKKVTTTKRKTSTKKAAAVAESKDAEGTDTVEKAEPAAEDATVSEVVASEAE